MAQEFYGSVHSLFTGDSGIRLSPSRPIRDRRANGESALRTALQATRQLGVERLDQPFVLDHMYVDVPHVTPP